MRCRLQIGPYILPSAVVLAPMAGVTDRPFRVLCRRLGAGLAASEMISSDTRLWTTPKSRHRMNQAFSIGLSPTDGVGKEIQQIDSDVHSLAPSAPSIAAMLDGCNGSAATLS